MMPLRKKVADFIRQLSVNNQAENVASEQFESADASSQCFIQKYLAGYVSLVIFRQICKRFFTV